MAFVDSTFLSIFFSFSFHSCVAWRCWCHRCDATFRYVLAGRADETRCVFAYLSVIFRSTRNSIDPLKIKRLDRHSANIAAFEHMPSCAMKMPFEPRINRIWVACVCIIVCLHPRNHSIWFLLDTLLWHALQSDCANMLMLTVTVWIQYFHAAAREREATTSENTMRVEKAHLERNVHLFGAALNALQLSRAVQCCWNDAKYANALMRWYVCVCVAKRGKVKLVFSWFSLFLLHFTCSSLVSLNFSHSISVHWIDAVCSFFCEKKIDSTVKLFTRPVIESFCCYCLYSALRYFFLFSFFQPRLGNSAFYG